MVRFWCQRSPDLVIPHGDSVIGIGGVFLPSNLGKHNLCYLGRKCDCPSYSAFKAAGGRSC